MSDRDPLVQLYRDALAVSAPPADDFDVYDSHSDAESAGYTAGVRDALQALGYPVDQLDEDEETCSECGNPLTWDEGAGYDGRCGDCADRHEAWEGDDDDERA